MAEEIVDRAFREKKNKGKIRSGSKKGVDFGPKFEAAKKKLDQAIDNARRGYYGDMLLSFGEAIMKFYEAKEEFVVGGRDPSDLVQEEIRLIQETQRRIKRIMDERELSRGIGG